MDTTSERCSIRDWKYLTSNVMDSKSIERHSTFPLLT